MFSTVVTYGHHDLGSECGHPVLAGPQSESVHFQWNNLVSVIMSSHVGLDHGSAVHVAGPQLLDTETYGGSLHHLFIYMHLLIVGYVPV